jgi:putative transposase
MKLHTAAHTVYKTQYHIVWVTRYRRKILVEGVAAYLGIKLREVQKYYPDWHFTEIGIDKDHVHVHMVIPPKYSVSFVVETIKKNTSRRLREKCRFLDKVYWDRGGIWSTSALCPRLGLQKILSGGM